MSGRSSRARHSTIHFAGSWELCCCDKTGRHFWGAVPTPAPISDNFELLMYINCLFTTITFACWYCIYPRVELLLFFSMQVWHNALTKVNFARFHLCWMIVGLRTIKCKIGIFGIYLAPIGTSLAQFLRNLLGSYRCKQPRKRNVLV